MKLFNQRLKSATECEIKPKAFDLFAAPLVKQAIRRRLSDVTHNRSEESGVSGTACPCPLCRSEPRSASPQPEKTCKVWDEGEEHSFTWFLEKLAELSEFSDFALLIPETVVFKRSKPAFMLQMNKDGFLRGNLASEKIKKEDIIRNFNNVVRARKRDEIVATPFGKTTKPQSKPASTADVTAYGKEIALVRHYAKGFDNETVNLRPQDEEGPVHVALESEFFEMMFERGGSSFWKSLVYIQTVLKCKVGLNEVILVSYDSNNPGTDPDISPEKLMKRFPEEFCAVVMRKICTAFRNIMRLEILGMDCEFMKDDNGVIWLYYVRKLFIKQLPEMKIKKCIEESPLEREENRQKLFNHIIAVGNSSPANTNTARLMSIMSNQFEEVKVKTGIEEVLREKPKDVISIAAYSRLRPRSKYSFDQILDLEPKSTIINRSRLSSASRQSRPVKLSDKVRPSTSSSKTRSTTTTRTAKGWHYTPRVKLRHFKLSGKSLSSI
mmetsp:Transcript_17229/g.30998  ORF Transcript_17229/g.30998 Transcript_17229/m.30998 type:complete len:495 (+) Transcript_17229:1533-3017(+)